MSGHTIMRDFRVRIVVLILAAAALAACSTAPGKDSAYKDSVALPPLEVPPDLITPPVDENMVIAAVMPRAESVAAPAAPVRLERDGALRWLAVTGSVEALWPKLRAFFQENGMSIERDDAKLGLIESGWMRGLPAQWGEIPGTSGQPADSQYKYRARLESGRAPGTSEIYFSYLGAQSAAGAWTLHTDPLLEAEMLKRLALFLGGTGAAMAEPAAGPRGVLTQTDDGHAALEVEESFDQVWRRAGTALDRGGFVIDDRQRAEGVYLLRLGDALRGTGLPGAPEGRDRAVRLRIEARGKLTRLTVLDAQGQFETTDFSERVLHRLQELMR